MSITIAGPIPTDTPRLSLIEMREAREWIEDSFEDAPTDLDSIEIEQVITRNYVGGLAQFITDGETR